MDQADGEIPVDGDHFLTPPNALRVKCRLVFANVVLSARRDFRCAGAPDHAGRLGSPRHSRDSAIPCKEPAACGELDAGGAAVRLVRRDHESRLDIFDPRKLERIMIFQGLDDGKPRTMYIDEITIDDAQPASARLPLLRQDKRSALSEAVSASTRAMSDHELLTMVQEACFATTGRQRIPMPAWPLKSCRETRILWRLDSGSWPLWSAWNGDSSPTSKAWSECRKSRIFCRPLTGFTASGHIS